MRRRTRRDSDVAPATAIEVLERDDGCVAVRLGEPAADCRGRLTLDHVNEFSRKGRRPPGDPAHLLALCEEHAGLGSSRSWNTGHRDLERCYLAVQYPGTWVEWLISHDLLVQEFLFEHGHHLPSVRR